MSQAAVLKSQPQTRSIVVDEVFPHAADVIWKALTDGALIGRWMMQPTGFEPVVGNRFTFKTTPAGAWDGLIRCEVLEVKPLALFSFAWRGGDEANIGYGSKLDTVVTFTLAPSPQGGKPGTRLRVEHAGFLLPKNETAYTNMSNGWIKCVQNLSAVSGSLN